MIPTNPPAPAERQPAFLRVALLTLMGLPALMFINTRGSIDMLIWRKWVAKFAMFGPIEGYHQIRMDYPPLTSQLLGFSSWLGAKFGASDPAIAIKVSLVIACWITVGVFWRLTGNYRATVMVSVPLIYYSIVQGYLDVYYAPLLLGAFAALSARRYSLFALLYALSLTIKWQPLILAPILFIHILRDLAGHSTWPRAVGFFSLRVLGPCAAVALLLVAVFGFESIADALHVTFHGRIHWALSLDALNLPWIVSHFLEWLAPGHFGAALIDGEGQILKLPTEHVLALSRLPFDAAYALVFLFIVMKPCSPRNTLLGCVMAFLTYFLLNTGVHENHLFIPMLLAMQLFATGMLPLEAALCLVLMLTGNLVVMNGLDGQVQYSRDVLPSLDVALLMAVANVIIGGFLLFFLGRQMRADAVPERQTAPFVAPEDLIELRNVEKVA